MMDRALAAREEEGSLVIPLDPFTCYSHRPGLGLGQ